MNVIAKSMYLTSKRACLILALPIIASWKRQDAGAGRGKILKNDLSNPALKRVH
jgi:hypothetical protein